jgi:hypothetical protein
VNVARKEEWKCNSLEPFDCFELFAVGFVICFVVGAAGTPED